MPTSERDAPSTRWLRVAGPAAAMPATPRRPRAADELQRATGRGRARVRRPSHPAGGSRSAGAVAWCERCRCCRRSRRRHPPARRPWPQARGEVIQMGVVHERAVGIGDPERGPPQGGGAAHVSHRALQGCDHRRAERREDVGAGVRVRGRSVPVGAEVVRVVRLPGHGERGEQPGDGGGRHLAPQGGEKIPGRSGPDGGSIGRVEGCRAGPEAIAESYRPAVGADPRARRARACSALRSEWLTPK